MSADTTHLLRGHDGKLFDPLDIRPGAITIEGVARALSHIPRFSGNADRNYSVAEHSMRVSKLAPEGYKLEGLLHDAHECILGDIPTPAKRALGERALLVDSIIEGEVRMQFGLSPCISQQVREADEMAFFIETAYAYEDLTAFIESGYPSIETIAGLTGEHVRTIYEAETAWWRWSRGVSLGLSCYAAEEAETEFLHRYWQTGGK
jgi:5'-deoxynucleotidase YfbR-like HD superfamily hydrolase